MPATRSFAQQETTIRSLDLALERLCLSLQLPEPAFDAAKAEYGAVGQWLIQPGSTLVGYEPRIYHQGSMLLETTVRPAGQAEYDLDAVCQMRRDPGWTPRQLFDAVWKRLKENPDYADNLQDKTRCLRLRRKGKFHLDIVPALSDPSWSPTGIRIPDLPVPTERWKHSNPKGFHGWFLEQCKKPPKVVYMSESMARGTVDPIPSRTAYQRKYPLQKVVQLVKRWRDVAFQGRGHLSTPSIVITKLAADAYEPEDDLYRALLVTLRGVSAFLAGGTMFVVNPSEPREVISESWAETPARHAALRTAIVEFLTVWERLPVIAGGLSAFGQAFERLFGTEGMTAIRAALTEIESPAPTRPLRMVASTGLLTATPMPKSIPVKGHTFHGS